MTTENQIREALIIIQRAVTENPEALERVAMEIEGGRDKPWKARIVGGDHDLVDRIVKAYRADVVEVDHSALADQIVKAYKGGQP